MDSTSLIQSPVETVTRKNEKPGGQKGHKGNTLKQVESPNFIEDHAPQHCEQCHHDLSASERLHHESRQVFDLPPLDLEITEHRAHQKCCGQCGAINQGSFPADVTQPAQYGSKIKGLMVYLNQYQLIPFERTSEFFQDIFHQSVSVSTVARAIESAYIQLAPAELHIKEQLVKFSFSFKKIMEKMAIIAGNILVITPATLAFVCFSPNKSNKLKSAPAQSDWAIIKSQSLYFNFARSYEFLLLKIKCNIVNSANATLNRISRIFIGSMLFSSGLEATMHMPTIS